ncbi:DUF58 domain-containing protein [Halorussus gelatinilyticus]|uniref:DUF58 domain-containing protein n=1 Tax=Halorussus gelatinilyticus TaxID=2937524 RepID=A0A8U0IP13_9EURY|nr:DUF58 domain-containing protein [Halorussus gelatinilyticus]UPW02202.1 DUF58 domain-containing protein [Halorussus gelatinilyticus]
MLTRRGWALAAVAVGGFLMAATFSARSLNAVVGPVAIALAAGYLQVKRAGQPELRTETPEYGFAGETVPVSLSFDASTPLAATVRLDADEGLTVADSAVETTVADESLSFDVTLRERGFQSVGPVEVVAEDVLGVWTETYTYPVSREVVVFPEIHRLRDASDLAALHREFGLGGRDRFDQLREYERGDPLRNVHWKSSAKRPDDELVVMEFEDEEEREQVELLAEAEGGRMDDVAEAAASVLTYLLDAGLAVGLTVPGGRVEPGTGPDHRTELLTLLARTYPGTVGDSRRDRADVLVQSAAEEDDVRVTVGDRTVSFSQLSGGSRGGEASRMSATDDRTAFADGGSDVSGGERR